MLGLGGPQTMTRFVQGVFHGDLHLFMNVDFTFIHDFYDYMTMTLTF